MHRDLSHTTITTVVHEGITTVVHEGIFPYMYKVVEIRAYIGLFYFITVPSVFCTCIIQKKKKKKALDWQRLHSHSQMYTGYKSIQPCCADMELCAILHNVCIINSFEHIRHLSSA